MGHEPISTEALRTRLTGIRSTLQDAMVHLEDNHTVLAYKLAVKVDSYLYDLLIGLPKE